jgi:hypothetical protein
MPQTLILVQLGIILTTVVTVFIEATPIPITGIRNIGTVAAAVVAEVVGAKLSSALKSKRLERGLLFSLFLLFLPTFEISC